MSLEIEERLPPDKEREYNLTDRQVELSDEYDWDPYMREEEGDDDGDD